MIKIFSGSAESLYHDLHDSSENQWRRRLVPTTVNVFLFFSYNMHSFNHIHTIHCIRRHSPRPLSISLSLVSSVGKTSLWCRAEIEMLNTKFYLAVFTSSHRSRQIKKIRKTKSVQCFADFFWKKVVGGFFKLSIGIKKNPDKKPLAIMFFAALSN